MKMYGNVCCHYKSFVGRDFKGWAQIALFIMGPYLNDGRKRVPFNLLQGKHHTMYQKACIHFYASGISDCVL